MRLPENIDAWIKTFTLLGAVVTFAWGVVQFLAVQASQVETRRIEATKPFLERQLKLYTEATQAAATLAISNDPTELDYARNKFWSENWPWLKINGLRQQWFSSAKSLRLVVPVKNYSSSPSN